MRGIVIAKTFTLALWGLYLAIGLTQPTGDVGSQNRASFDWSDEVRNDENISEDIGVIPSIAITTLIIMGVYFSLNPPAEEPAIRTNEASVGQSPRHFLDAVKTRGRAS